MLLLLLLILLLFVTSFMQSIYTYMSETNHDSREQCCSYSTVAIHGASNAISHVKRFFTFTLVHSEVCVSYFLMILRLLSLLLF